MTATRPVFPHIQIMRKFDPEWWEACKQDGVVDAHKEFCERNGFEYDGRQTPAHLVRQIYARIDKAA